MPKKGESPYKRTMGLDVPHPFAKEVPKKKPKGRPPKPKAKPKKVVKTPKKIVMPTGRDMDEAIIKIQKQFLIDKNKFKKSNGGTMNKQSQLGARLMYTIDRINRDKSLSKPQKREILKKGLKGIRKIRNMNMGGVMRGRGGTFKGVY